MIFLRLLFYLCAAGCTCEETNLGYCWQITLTYPSAVCYNHDNYIETINALVGTDNYISKVTELAKTTKLNFFTWILEELLKCTNNCPDNFHHCKYLCGVEPIDKVSTSKEHRLVYNVSKTFLSLISKLVFYTFDPRNTLVPTCTHGLFREAKNKVSLRKAVFPPCNPR